MPTDLDDLEVASPFGALDATVVSSPSFVHAHTLREMQKNGRRLSGRGEYLLAKAWRQDGSDDVEGEVGSRVFDAPIGWSCVIDGTPVFRKRHLRLGSIQIRSRITNGATVLFQVVTRGSGLTQARSSTATNVISATGSGSWVWYASDEIVLGPHDTDLVSLWVTADATVTFDTGAFGTPATGTPTTVNRGLFTDSGAAWDVSAINARPGLIMVEFLNADGAVIAARRSVFALDATTLQFTRNLNGTEWASAQNPGVTYRLAMVPGVRLGAVNMREIDEF